MSKRHHVSTRYRLENNHYPSLQITWIQDEDLNGWTGKTSIWTDGNTRQDCNHTVTIRDCSPLGTLAFQVDGFEYGCWSMGHIDGCDITKRDLQWATAWAAESIRRKHYYLPCEKSEAQQPPTAGGEDED